MSALKDNDGQKAGKRAGMALSGFLLFGLFVWYFELGDLYGWLKVFHIVAVISWMAGMVYLPRLFVYHAEAELGSVQSDTFKVMERRLLKIIMTPAMLLSWVFGLVLAFQLSAFSEFWFWIKFLAVIGMTICHGYFAKAVKSFAADTNKIPARKWRMYNEIPTVLMIIAVIVVVLKPGI